MKPNAKRHNPDPNYLRSLIEAAELSISEAARRIGVKRRTMACYLSESESRTTAPYSVQFCLEVLADSAAR